MVKYFVDIAVIMLFNTVKYFLPEVYLRVCDNTNYVHTLFSETLNFTCNKATNDKIDTYRMVKVARRREKSHLVIVRNPIVSHPYYVAG